MRMDRSATCRAVKKKAREVSKTQLQDQRLGGLGLHTDSLLHVV